MWGVSEPDPGGEDLPILLVWNLPVYQLRSTDHTKRGVLWGAIICECGPWVPDLIFASLVYGIYIRHVYKYFLLFRLKL